MKTARIATKARGQQRNQRREQRIAYLRSLSSIEGKAIAIDELKRLAAAASFIAAEKAIRVGLPKVYATDTEVVKEIPGGAKQLLLARKRNLHKTAFS